MATPVRSLAPLIGATSVAVGGDDACAIVVGGVIECWGGNDFGQLGDGSETTAHTPVRVVGLADATALALGNMHGCAVFSGGSVKCWGDDSYGQLAIEVANNPAPVTIAGLGDVVEISAGYFHTCVLLTGGNVECWGDNEFGQLGDGSTDSPLGPVAVKGLSGVTHISSSEYHSCAVVAGGAVKCWGNFGLDDRTASGDTSAAHSLPVQVVGVSGTSAVSAGVEWNCAIVETGAVSCWKTYSDDGSNAMTGASIVAGLTKATAVTTSGGSCAIVVDRTTRCWGVNVSGELGDGTTTDSHSPVQVLNLADVVQISAGPDSACAVNAAGAVMCWGNNDNGQLGDGTTTSRPTPVNVLVER